MSSKGRLPKGVRIVAGGMEPAYPSPCSVGERVRVTGMLCVTNSAGGTTIVRHAGVECVVTKAWWDYETGWRYHGTPVEPEDAAEIRRQAWSEYGPDWHRRHRPKDKEGLARAERARREWNPDTVYFSQFDVEKARP